MSRKPVRPNPALSALMDERDDLRIRISLLAESKSTNPAELTELQDQLYHLEQRISVRQRMP